MTILSRRELLLSTSALALAACMQAAAKPRLRRADCFFGLHFDLHPTPEDLALGRDVTEQMIERLLDAVHPDFVQYDSKGHPGYLGFPSKTGMSAPHIVQDSLAIWRRVTARRGVALYNHFSGVLDGLAVTKHPDWARITSTGAPDKQETSLFSPYEDDLMIPELKEAALNYNLDGSWVDGDCWAVQPDYCEPSAAEFRRKTGIQTLPKKPSDQGWIEFLDIQRERFRQYVNKYAAALHNARPGYEITSNWMYSTFAPEHPSLPLDYLSGDIADQAPARRARIESRYFAACGKTWDLMSWGFENDPHFGHMSDKPVVAIEQEAAIVISQGGAFQIYYTPTRTGWIDDRVVHAAVEVASFCRTRQELSFRSETVPEAAIFFSGRTLYKHASRPFGPWGSAMAPAEGAVDVMVACGYSTDIVPDWKAAKAVHDYPLVVVPDWVDIGDAAAKVLADYVAAGGNMLCCGAANAELFAPLLHFQLNGPAARKSYFIAGDAGFADVGGEWVDLTGVNVDIVLYAYRTLNSERDKVPLGIHVRHGKGSAVICPGPLTTEYAIGRTPLIQSAVRTLARSLRAPRVTIDSEFPWLEVVLRTKKGDLFVHFINVAGAPVTSEFRHTGFVPGSGSLNIAVQLRAAPTRVLLQPGGQSLTGEYKDGAWHGTVPSVHIHSILQFIA